MGVDKVGEQSDEAADDQRSIRNDRTRCSVLQSLLQDLLTRLGDVRHVELVSEQRKDQASETGSHEGERERVFLRERDEHVQSWRFSTLNQQEVRLARRQCI